MEFISILAYCFILVLIWQGYASFNVTVESDGGHSSLPVVDGSSAISILAGMIANSERHPPSRGLVSPMDDFFRSMAPFVHPAVRPVFYMADKW